MKGWYKLVWSITGLLYRTNIKEQWKLYGLHTSQRKISKYGSGHDSFISQGQLPGVVVYHYYVNSCRPELIAVYQRQRKNWYQGGRAGYSQSLMVNQPHREVTKGKRKECCAPHNVTRCSLPLTFIDALYRNRLFICRPQLTYILYQTSLLVPKRRNQKRIPPSLHVCNVFRTIMKTLEWEEQVNPSIHSLWLLYNSF